MPRQPVNYRHQQGGQDEQARRGEVGRIPGEVAAARVLHLGEEPVAEDGGSQDDGNISLAISTRDVILRRKQIAVDIFDALMYISHLPESAGTDR